MSRSLMLHNDTRELQRLVDFVEALCCELELDHTDSMSLQLALEEAVVNIMQYAFAPGTTGEITISVEHDAGGILFSIEDSGLPFDPTEVADADVSLPADQREVGGLGIYIVRQIMDKVEYSRCGERNILRLTKTINR